MGLISPQVFNNKFWDGKYHSMNVSGAVVSIIHGACLPQVNMQVPYLLEDHACLVSDHACAQQLSQANRQLINIDQSHRKAGPVSPQFVTCWLFTCSCGGRKTLNPQLRGYYKQQDIARQEKEAATKVTGLSGTNVRWEY